LEGTAGSKGQARSFWKEGERRARSPASTARQVRHSVDSKRACHGGCPGGKQAQARRRRTRAVVCSGFSYSERVFPRQQQGMKRCAQSLAVAQSLLMVRIPTRWAQWERHLPHRKCCRQAHPRTTTRATCQDCCRTSRTARLEEHIANSPSAPSSRGTKAQVNSRDAVLAKSA
jgi:hypothetical protein